MRHGWIGFLMLGLLTFWAVCASAEPKEAPNVDAWVTFDYHDVFHAAPARDSDKQVCVKDARQLFALVHPDAAPESKAVHDVEQALVSQLKIRNLDWTRYMLIAATHGDGRFQVDSRLDLRWAHSGKLEARWSYRDVQMRTCTSWAFALVEKTDAEVVFTKPRWLYP